MKTLATLATVSILTLAGAAIAQTTSPAQPQAPEVQDQQTAPTQPDAQRVRGRRLTEADLQALTDARMAAIRTGLKLTAEQQRLWEPVEQSLRAIATERAERFAERRERRAERRAQRGQADQEQQPDLAERLEQHAQRMTQSAQRLTALSEAVKPFYASLSEDQRRLLPVLMRQNRGSFMRMGMHRGGDRRGMMGHGSRHH